MLKIHEYDQDPFNGEPNWLDDVVRSLPPTVEIRLTLDGAITFAPLPIPRRWAHEPADW